MECKTKKLANVEDCSLAFGLVSLGNELLQLTYEVDHCSLASNYIDEADFQVIFDKFYEYKILTSVLSSSVWIVRNNTRFYGEVLYPIWRTTPCRLSATAHSIYSQLPSIL